MASDKIRDWVMQDLLVKEGDIERAINLTEQKVRQEVLDEVWKLLLKWKQKKIGTFRFVMQLEELKTKEELKK